MSKIVNFKINNIPVLKREGNLIFFSHFTSLEEGKNPIHFEVMDKAGNKTLKKIIVIRKVPEVLQIAERISLTVFPFEKKRNFFDTSYSFQDYLVDSLVNQNRFRIVERNLIDSILNEQKISKTRLIERSTALKIGKLVAAHSIVTGSIIETHQGVEIVSRMIDTETSEIIATVDVFDEGNSFASFKSMAQGMAIKFHRDFPLVDGQIIKCKGNDIFTDLGENVIKLRRGLIVYREEPIKHPLTKNIFGLDTQIIGRARVTQVQPQISKAELVDIEQPIVMAQDRVITQ